jgi:PHD/YefM family antitoxin component YafN of YafNO toxin-antitoxin module
MAAYSQEEIFTATQMVRNFSAIVTEVSEGKRKRAVIVKNNRFEAVLLNMHEYERMQEAVEILEKIYAKTKRA